MVSQYVQILSVLVVLAVMSSAAFHDVRTREVPDWHWILLGVFSTVMALWHSVPTAIGTGLLTLYMCSSRVEGLIATMVLCLSLVSFAIACLTDASECHLNMGIPVLFLSGVLFYVTGLLKGGADAKAFMSLSLVVPAYPGFQLLWGPVYPQAYLMPPSLAVLLTALLLTLVPMAVLFVVNLSRGYRGKGIATTYVLPIDVAEESHVWPVEDIVNGIVTRRPPSDDPGTYIRLRDAGMDGVRVTPMIPFLLPMAVASTVVLVLGNPFMVLFP